MHRRQRRRAGSSSCPHSDLADTPLSAVPATERLLLPGPPSPARTYLLGENGAFGVRVHQQGDTCAVTCASPAVVAGHQVSEPAPGKQAGSEAGAPSMPCGQRPCRFQASPLPAQCEANPHNGRQLADHAETAHRAFSCLFKHPPFGQLSGIE